MSKEVPELNSLWEIPVGIAITLVIGYIVIEETVFEKCLRNKKWEWGDYFVFAFSPIMWYRWLIENPRAAQGKEG